MDINYYKVPPAGAAAANQLYDVNQVYGKLIPSDVQATIMEENAALAKQIEDQRNNEFFNELKKLYETRWKAYKDEFYSASGPAEKNSVRCLAYVLYHSDIALCRRVLLAECYANVAEGKDEFFPPTIEQLPMDSSLMKKIESGTQGNIDFPSSPLIMT